MRHTQGPNLEVWVSHTPLTAPGFHDDRLAVLEPPIADELAAAHAQADAVLLYTPMALPLLKAVKADVPVFYGCMAELSAFKDAPRQLRQPENELLERAAVVLTGGPLLYAAKRDLHPQVDCLPSAVDAAHFDRAGLEPDSAAARAAAALQDGVPQPPLGYFGVIEKRLDVAVVGTLAERHPGWQSVMAGPVVKIDPATLPQRPNLDGLGMQPCAHLPYLLAGWDVALMPFALNESTRFINPTKTLEYMAGEKPVVSTAVRDVISLYGHGVDVAHDSDAFVAACEKLLGEDAAARYRRGREMTAIVPVRSRDRAAHDVDKLPDAALRQTRAVQAANEAALSSALLPVDAALLAAAAGC